MKHKTLNILFIVSMAFNIAFVGSFFYHQVKFRHIPGPGIGKDMPPPPPMLRKNFREGMQASEMERREFMEASRMFFDTITSEEFDEEEANRLLDDMISKQMVMERKMGNGMISMRKNLKPEELKDVREFVEKRRDKFNKNRLGRPKDEKKDRRRREQ